MKIIVFQIGAREHYAVARALYNAGMLAVLVTDWWAYGKGSVDQYSIDNRQAHRPRSAVFPANIRVASLTARLLSIFLGRAAQAARCNEIPDQLVYSFPLRSLFWKWQIRMLTNARTSYQAFLRTDKAFASAVAKIRLPPHDVVFGFSYASLEAFQYAKARGALTILDQIDPGPVHFRIVAEEESRFPDAARPPQPFPDAYFARNRREWDLADVILVNSEWTREAIIFEGADPNKIEIIPLAYEPPASASHNSESLILPSRLSSSPLHVLFLGQVTAGKGIYYLIEAARLLKNENARFDIVGPIGIAEPFIRSAPSNVVFHGRATRDTISEWYHKADIFVLPTLSDGFALTQLEAMAHGLPVISTPNCGRVVEYGKTGFIIPPRNAQALADAIRRFAKDRSLSPSMSPACRNAVKNYYLENFANRLKEIINKQVV